MQASPTAAEVHQEQLESEIHLDSLVWVSQEEAVKPALLEYSHAEVDTTMSAINNTISWFIFDKGR